MVSFLNIHKSLSSIFFIFLLLTSLVPVNAQDDNSTQAQSDQVTDEQSPDQPEQIPGQEPQPPNNENQNASYLFPPEEQEQLLGGPVEREPFPGQMCVEKNLNENNQSNNILGLLKDGFVGQKITGNAKPEQTPTASDRDTLANDKLLLEHPNDPGLVSEVTAPNKKFSPFEVTQYLNTSIKGPFAFGLILGDTVRTGRCKELDANCFLTGKNLKFRNSDDGILASVKPLRDVKDKLVSYFTDENKNATNFSSEEEQVAAAAFFTDDVLDEGGIKTAQRLEKEYIPNSVKTEDFYAKIGTNCTTDCVISTYSLFDKYFNQWLSSEMVLSTFGPTLLYKTKKLFGWLGRRGSFIREEWQAFLDWFRVNFEQPESFLGRVKLERMHTRLGKNHWESWWQQLTTGNADGTGYPLVKTQEFKDWWSTKGEEFIHGLKTVQQKAEFVRVLKDLRTYARVQHYELNKANSAYNAVRQKLLNAGVANVDEHPEAKKALIDYGRAIGKFIQNYDDQLGLDLPDWFVRYPNVGFLNKGIRDVSSGEVRDLVTDHRYTRVMIDKFVDSGNWKNFDKEFHLYNGAFEVDEAGNMILYAINPNAPTTNAVRNLSYGNIDRAQETTRFDNFIKTDYDEMIPYRPGTVPLLKKRASGNVAVYEGKWEPVQAMTPEEFVRRIANPRLRGNFNKIVGNVEAMLNETQELNFVSRRYWNALDKLMAEEDEIIRSYFQIKGGAKWTAYPFGYWWAKQGFSIEEGSFFQLPDDWAVLFMSLGPEKELYDYSYVDFFANAGSDQGDLFVKVLNVLPWKFVLDKANENFNPAREVWEGLSGKSLRGETEDLAYYLTGVRDCDNCSITIFSNSTSDFFSPFFNIQNKPFTSYILEDTQSIAAKEKGTTLIAFSHGLNLKGKTKEIEGEEINIAKARENDLDEDPEKKPESCLKAVQTLPVYGSLQKTFTFLPTGTGVGGALAAAESLTYATFFWPGVFTSVAIQLAVAPELQDCVDVEGGYYVHYFIPTKKEEAKDDGRIQLSSEKVPEMVSRFAESLKGGFSSQDNNSPVKQQIEKLGNELEAFAQKAEKSSIVQATIHASGQTSGQLRGHELFYFWCGPGCEKYSLYKNDGVETISDNNSKKKVALDFGKGQLTVDGTPIVTDADAVRSAAQDLRIPADILPQNLTVVCVEPTPELGIEISAQGEATVVDPEVFNCIQNGVFEQTGVPLNTSNLSEAFGKVESVVTTTHPNVFPNTNEIVAEGIPRKVASGADARIFIAKDQNVSLSRSNDGSNSLGYLKAIRFKNGIINARPDGCFVTWLRHHEQAILDQKDVAGIKPTLTTSTNPENGCEEPAIDLEVVANPESSLSQARVQNFNDSVKHLGPFQIFDTPTKRYVLFSERDEQGVCQDHLRVIDKETGEIQDFVGKAKQTPTGIKFTDENGKEHTLDFSAPNGVPQVSFDGQKPETLTSAQGRNGSFWYDPTTGQWYAENSQLLPLLEAFRDGIATSVGPDNEASSTASGNVLNLSVGDTGSSGPLNLPSLPENNALLFFFIVSLVAVIVVIRQRELGKKTNF